MVMQARQAIIFNRGPEEKEKKFFSKGGLEEAPLSWDYVKVSKESMLCIVLHSFFEIAPQAKGQKFNKQSHYL